MRGREREKQKEGGRGDEREKGQLWLPGEPEQLRVFYEVPG